MIGLMAKKMMIDEWEIIMLPMLLNDLVQFASSVMDQSAGTIFVGNRNRDWRSGSTEPPTSSDREQDTGHARARTNKHVF